MSNHLALAGVTATVVELLNDVVGRDLPGATAAGGRPDKSLTDARPHVVVFLYRVESNAAWRNEDLPTRAAGGELRTRPRAALTLHYLLTFAGNESEYEPQRMLGSVAGALHFHPVLSRADIARMTASRAPGHPLAGVDVAAQPDLIRLTPVPLSTGDLSGLWSSFFQVDYRLSVAYRAETVLLTPPSAPASPRPVRERRLVVSTARGPALHRVVASPDAEEPLFAGSSVALTGAGLAGDEVTVVRFGDAEAVPSSTSPGHLLATVPDTVPAGTVPVVVEHRRRLGSPPRLRPSGRSNVRPVVVHPRIRHTPGGYKVSVTDLVRDAEGLRSGTLRMTVDPAVRAAQDVSVLLDPVGGGAGFAFFDDRRDGPGSPAETHDLALPLTRLPGGDYLVRLVVSGAHSPLDTAEDGTPVEPRVSVS
ncbi:DUF4255 domain-containing protein [Streptomyces sp. NPDC048420]|uniref:DUF4255 domain-containing protein n=1 Tax=Streptomyces sp. NPDC048420 TaxID=3155755 RepID=UPI0034449D96